MPGVPITQYFRIMKFSYFCLTLPVSIRRRLDVHTTSITLKQRRMDVKKTSCAYWALTADDELSYENLTFL